MTKVFFDTEFTGLHQFTTLISLGLVSECGKTFYAEFNDYDPLQIDDWLQKNVIDNLTMKAPPADEDEFYSASRSHDNPDGNLYCGFNCQMRGSSSEIRPVLVKWLAQFDKIEMWGDCLSYDWILFIHIFGNAFSLPKSIYYIPFDICTLFKAKGIDPDISREEFCGMVQHSKKHNALWDARVIRRCFELI